MTKKEILEIPCWSYKEIMSYYTHIKSKSTAIRMKNEAIKKFNGSVPYGNHLASRDSVLKMLGTTVERELEVIKNCET